MTDLATLSDAMAWAGVTSDPDNQFSSLVIATFDEIKKWIGYDPNSQTYIKSFNGNGGYRMVFPDRPVTSINSVTINNLSIPASVNQSNGYSFDDKNLYLVGSLYYFARGYQNVTVSYVAGYSVIPNALLLACKIWAKATWDRAQRQGGTDAISIQAGDSSIKFSEPKISDLNSFIAMPNDVKTLLQPYVRIVPV